MQGESLLPAFRGETETREGPLFWEWKNGKAARSGNWKIVKDGPDNPWDLYDLTDDPSETNNLAEMHPEKVLELEKQFMDWKALVSKRPDGTVSDDSEEYNIH